VSDETRDLLRTPWAADRCCPAHGDLVRSRGVGGDPSGGDGVGCNALAGDFEGDGLGEAYHPRFGGMVGGIAPVSL